VTAKKTEPRPPEEVEDGDEALKRLATLTRKVMQVPKSELPTRRKPHR
jgi:hypothetical protein